MKKQTMRFLALAAAVLVLLPTLLSGCQLQQNMPELDLSLIENLQQTTMVYDDHGKLIASMSGGENRVIISIDQLPEHVTNAFVAAEDVRFYQHNGLDIRRIFGAMWANVKSGSLAQGASTITQQLIKLSHLTSEKTFTRKINEAWLALKLEQVYDKKDILEAYLNYVYFGNGYYGIEAAAQGYFHKPAALLTVDEAAMLAGVLKSTTKYAPHTQYENAISRRNVILGLMAEYGFITEAEAAQYKTVRPTVYSERPGNYDHGYAVELALSEAAQALNISYEDVISGGYRIQTSLDVELQTKCEQAFADDSLFPAAAADGTPCEGAIVILDSKTGNVRALMGGRSHTVARGWNRATQAYRQPGSAIKPVLVYGPAIDLGLYDAATPILDAPMDFNGYAPDNFGSSYNGVVTLRTAMNKSLNVPAVQIFNTIGVNTGKGYAQRAGIVFDETDDHLALALGGFTRGVTPMMLAGAYLPFANGGTYYEPSVLLGITLGDGTPVWENPHTPTTVFGTDAAYIMADILVTGVQNGTGRRLQALGYPVGAKTGTVGYVNGENSDLWTAAVSTEWVAVCWMGFDNTDGEHCISSSLTGGSLPAQVIANVMADETGDTFSRPATVQEATLDAYTLYAQQRLVLATGLTPENQRLTEIFRIDKMPTEESPYWQIPPTPTDFVAAIDGNAVSVSYTPTDAAAVYRLYRQTGSEPAAGRFESSGGTPVTLLDQDVEPGKVYTYYVIPARPDISINGGELTGDCTARIAILINGPEQTPEPSPLPGETPLPEASPLPEETPLDP